MGAQQTKVLSRFPSPIVGVLATEVIAFQADLPADRDLNLTSPRL